MDQHDASQADCLGLLSSRYPQMIEGKCKGSDKGCNMTTIRREWASWSKLIGCPEDVHQLKALAKKKPISPVASTPVYTFSLKNASKANNVSAATGVGVKNIATTVDRSTKRKHAGCYATVLEDPADERQAWTLAVLHHSLENTGSSSPMVVVVPKGTQVLPPVLRRKTIHMVLASTSSVSKLNIFADVPDNMCETLVILKDRMLAVSDAEYLFDAPSLSASIDYVGSASRCGTPNVMGGSVLVYRPDDSFRAHVRDAMINNSRSTTSESIIRLVSSYFTNGSKQWTRLEQVAAPSAASCTCPDLSHKEWTFIDFDGQADNPLDTWYSMSRDVNVDPCAAYGGTCKCASSAIEMWIKNAWQAWTLEIERPHSENTAAASSLTATQAPRRRVEDMLWMGPLFSEDGYGADARAFTSALQGVQFQLGSREFAGPDGELDEGILSLTTKQRDLLMRLADRTTDARHAMVVCDSKADTWGTKDKDGEQCPPSGSTFSVGRSTFSTDSLPMGWVERCNEMDEIWVPTRFHRHLYEQAGVDVNKIHVVPPAVDTEGLFNPNGTEPSPLMFGSHFNFIAVGKWDRRNNFELLLRSYCEEFSSHDNVVLYLRTDTPDDPGSSLQSELQRVSVAIGIPLDKLPRVELLPGWVTTAKMPGLYQAADAFVRPSSGEDFARATIEAMAMGLPVITTDWGSMSELATAGVVLPVHVAGLRQLGQTSLEQLGLSQEETSHKSPRPDHADLRKQLRWAFENEGPAKAIGTKARQYVVNNMGYKAVSDVVIQRYNEISGPELVEVVQKPTQPDVTNSIAGKTNTSAGATGKYDRFAWFGPVDSPTGYGSEARDFTIGLAADYHELTIRQFGDGASMSIVAELSERDRSLLTRAMNRSVEPLRNTAVLCHSTGSQWFHDNLCPPHGAGYKIGRTMFETNSLPVSWVRQCNKMDEVWVPSKFNAATFWRAGVHKKKLFVLPEAVDTENLFNPANVMKNYTFKVPSVKRSTDHLPPELQLLVMFGQATRRDEMNLLQVGQSTDANVDAEAPKSDIDTSVDPKEVFKFLAVSKWERRKGFDVLLKAFCEEFAPEEPVVLYIKTNKFMDDPDEGLHKLLIEVGEYLGRDVDRLPRISLIREWIPEQELPGLYNSADAFVLPTRGEGWGRPQAEAMAMGLPTITTDWGGTTEFINEDVALPLRATLTHLSDLDLIEMGMADLNGHMRAEPDKDQLRQHMRWVVENRAEARALGARAREHMRRNFSREPVERILLDHVKRVVNAKALGGAN